MDTDAGIARRHATANEIRPLRWQAGTTSPNFERQGVTEAPEEVCQYARRRASGFEETVSD
jgi:hypothetical protein